MEGVKKNGRQYAKHLKLILFFWYLGSWFRLCCKRREAASRRLLRSWRCLGDKGLEEWREWIWNETEWNDMKRNETEGNEGNEENEWKNEWIRWNAMKWNEMNERMNERIMDNQQKCLYTLFNITGWAEPTFSTASVQELKRQCLQWQMYFSVHISFNDT